MIEIGKIDGREIAAYEIYNDICNRAEDAIENKEDTYNELFDDIKMLKSETDKFIDLSKENADTEKMNLLINQAAVMIALEDSLSGGIRYTDGKISREETYSIEDALTEHKKQFQDIGLSQAGNEAIKIANDAIFGHTMAVFYILKNPYLRK